MVWFSVRSFLSPLWKVGRGSIGIFFIFVFDKLFLCTMNKYSLRCWYDYNTAAHWEATRTSATNINPTVCQWGLTSLVRNKSNRVEQQNTVWRRDKAYNLERLWNSLKKIKAWISFLTLGRLRSRRLGLVMPPVFILTRLEHLGSATPSLCPKALLATHYIERRKALTDRRKFCFWTLSCGVLIFA